MPFLILRYVLVVIPVPKNPYYIHCTFIHISEQVKPFERIRESYACVAGVSMLILSIHVASVSKTIDLNR